MMHSNRLFPLLLQIFVALGPVNCYWLMGTGFIATERLDPIVSPGVVASHVHSIMGGSNFGYKTTTAQLRQSKCTSTPIAQDKSNYWFPHLYFQWANGSFSSLTGGGVVYYLFSDDAGKTTAFPDDFRMISGDPTLRTYNASSHAQQAVTFLCLDFNGASTRHNEIPQKACPSGVRAQINMPSCWDGKNVDSPNHASHVAFPSGGPDSGTCSDPRYPVTLPRIFIEVYWSTGDFEPHRSSAKDTAQPFVFSYGDGTGYGYHADFFNGWDAGVLQRAVDKCHCNPYGDPTCCAQAGIFDFKPKGSPCFITPQVDEVATGTLAALPGNNPVQGPGNAVNGHVVLHPDTRPPGALYPPSAYTDKPAPGACAIGGKMGTNCQRGAVPGGGAAPAPPVPSSSASSSMSNVPTSASSAASSHTSAPLSSPASGSATSAPSSYSSTSVRSSASSHASSPASGSPVSHSPSAPPSSGSAVTSKGVHSVHSPSASTYSAPAVTHTLPHSPSSSPTVAAPSTSTPYGSNSGHSNHGHSNHGHSGHSNYDHPKPAHHNSGHAHSNHSGSGTCSAGKKHATKHHGRANWRRSQSGGIH